MHTHHGEVVKFIKKALECQFPPSTLFEIEFLFCHYVFQARWPVNSLGFSCLISLNYENAEVTEARYHISFYMNAGDWNSGPQSCTQQTAFTHRAVSLAPEVAS